MTRSSKRLWGLLTNNIAISYSDIVVEFCYYYFYNFDFDLHFISSCIMLHAYVTESKLVLLAGRQASKPGDEALGQGIKTYLQSQMTEKMADRCPGEPFSPSQNCVSFYTKKGRGCSWLLETSCCMNCLSFESAVLAAVHVDQIMLPV